MKLKLFRKPELLSFYFTLGILVGMVLIPGWFQLSEGRGGLLFSLKFIESAFHFAICLTATYFFSFAFFWLTFGRRWVNVASQDEFRSTGLGKTVPRLKYVFFFLLFAIPLWVLSIDINELINPTSRFHSQLPILTSLAQWLILGAMVVALLNTRSNSALWVFVLLLLSFYLIYPISISSRAVAFPFVIFTGYFLIIRRSFFLSLSFAFLTVTFYSAALATRGELGLYNFANFIIVHLNPVHSFNKFSEIFPGVGSISLALEMFDQREGFGFWRFLIYVSPVPSFLLPETIFEGLGFTEYLRARHIGLNTDVISEWIFWFGSGPGAFDFWLPAIIGGAFFTILTAAPVFLIKLGIVRSIAHRFAFQISIMFFVAAGMSLPVRGGTRLFIYVLAIVLVLWLARRIRIK